jgi:DNA polymerase-1
MKKRTLSFDTESTGLFPYRGDTMFSFSISDLNCHSSVHRVDIGKNRGKNKRLLKELMYDRKLRLVMHNSKYDLTVAQEYMGTYLEQHQCPEVEDTIILTKLMRSSLPSYNLKDLAHLLMGFPKDDERAVKEAAKVGGYHLVDRDLMTLYQHRDAQRTALLYLFAKGQWKHHGTPEMKALYRHEINFMWAIKRQERRGIRISPQRTEDQIVWLKREMDDALERIKDRAGRYVNPVGDQMRRHLYDDLGLPVLGGYTEKSKQPRLGKDELLLLKEQTGHPTVDDTLKYRSYQKGVANLRGYLLAAGSDDVVHPSINTYGASTGRPSCQDPNLYNVEKEASYENPYPVPARRCFITHPGEVTWYGDFKAIELRLIMLFAGDERIIQMFRDGVNLHEQMAEFWYREAYTKEKNKARKDGMYTACKSNTFGVGYGAGPDKSAKVLQLPLEVVKERWEEFKAVFPGFASLQKRTRDEVREKGYVVTAFGRRIYVPRNKPYVGVNYRVQGTAADILKIALWKVDAYLESEYNGEVALIPPPTYDELQGTFPRTMNLKKLPKVLREVKRIMCDFPELDVPMDVEFKYTTKSWAEAEEIVV